MKKKTLIIIGLFLVICCIFYFNCDQNNPLEPKETTPTDSLTVPHIALDKSYAVFTIGSLKFIHAFNFDFENTESIATGDVNGDGIDEIVHGDRGDWIKTYRMYRYRGGGSFRYDFRLTNSFKVDFEGADGLAVGDVYDRTNSAEIIHGDRGDWVRIYDLNGKKMSTFKLNFSGGDGEFHDILQAGNVTGDQKNEIIHADCDNQIGIYNMYGNTICRLKLIFDKGDGLAVGDVDGDGKDEIIHGDRDDWITIYDVLGSSYLYLKKQNSISLDYEGWDGLATGDVNGDGIEEIVHADRGNRIHVYDRMGTILVDFRWDYSGGDYLAVGDVNGDGIDEIIHADRDNWIYIIGVNTR